ncbi:SWI/SNF-related matrix-associated actin-dependent regulator of chromatin [Naegleria gruberi]|uniref:SWI/SNF-related matrix-associated actin-dependent regulator of chromatin n=1 Tax=Naegleria gruberi TaxID=5762 RepID=D2V6Z5_NAEGR|nr:SWI/SNF-related matrix-associated actin-dependent regulator of chromatin [Naegleria gruberi]EFC47285.1 SWI/SNF-related matrix-associated actin-dependent regulator of chromatin [Naegleria gruberi]|eukprot:XP_002680029.1 SWI/SNF-related matrix-associated actin-dependent regulator of chromatin [Naegleria gruberi strain NEG-M]
MDKQLSSQQLQLYMGLLKRLKSEGKDLNDPQYKSLHQFLKAQLNNQNQMKQQNQQTINNVLPTPVQPSLATINPQTLQQQQPQQQQSLFTTQQKERLKAQIYAFKHHISKREPIPTSLQFAIMGNNVENNLKEYETVYLKQGAPQSTTTTTNVGPVIPQPLQQQPNNVQLNTQLRKVQPNQPNQPQPFVNPNGQMIQAPNIPNQHVQMNAAKQMESKINPDSQRQQNLDLQTLYKEREKRIQHKMKRRFDNLKMSFTSLPQNEQVKAAIEIKQFQLLKQQKELRADIIRQLKNQSVTQNGESHIARTQSLVNEIPKKNRSTKPKEKNTNKSKKAILADLIAKKKKIKEAFKNDIKKPVDKINKDLTQFFEKKAKAEKEKKAKAEKARLKALKENDEEAYFKLLEQTKEGRLTELLKQTDSCLKSLGASLVSERDGDAEVVEFDQEEDGEKGGSLFKKFLLNQNNYYKVAHRLVEKVEKQPTILKGGDLKAYQIQGLQWLVSLYNNRLNGILADEMGLGKTIQTISLLSYLYEFKSNKGPHLVIVPLSTMDNWANEFEKWCPTLKLIRYSGTKQERQKIHLELKKQDFEVLLIQYEYITKEKKFMKKIQWNYIIMDEGHRIKNSDCKLVKALAEYTSRNRVLLTGTPLQNDLKELWALLHFLLPKIFDSSLNFENWFNSPFAASGEKVEMTEEEKLLIIHRLHQVLRPFLLRREKTDVEEQLPEKSEKVVYIDLSAMQKTLYQNIQDKNKIVLNGKKLRNTSLNNTVMQLRKVCNHPYLFFKETEYLNNLSDETYYDWMCRSSGKFELLSRIFPKLKRTGHRVLLFSQMTQILDIFEEFLSHLGYEYLRLDGAVNAADRGTLVKQWNAKDSPYFVFLLSTRSGGLGLNLQTADTVIMFDSDWNPQQDLQAMARAHRIGQTKSVLVLTFCTRTPVEEKVRDRAQEKRDAEAKVIKAGKFNQKSTILERQELLETLLKKESDIYSAHEAPSDEQMNNLLARSDDEFEIFQTMDKEQEAQLIEKYGENVPPRLMSADELPSWIREVGEEEEEEKEELGRGRRKRAESSIIDSSDEEDGDEDDEEVAEPEEEPEEEEEEEENTKKRKRKAPVKKEEPAAKKKKAPGPGRGRKKKVVEEEPTLGYSYDGKSYDKVLADLSDTVTKKLYQIYMDIGNTTDDTGKSLVFPFLELPNKEEYPTYYEIIKNPICLHDIERKVRNGSYLGIDDMERDVKLLVSNAKTYNLEGSPIYVDAETIEQLFIRKKTLIFNAVSADELIDEMDDNDLPPF